MTARRDDSLAALVLAAGYSSRMGEFKPLLPVGPAPALERAIDTFRRAGIADIAVVTGHRAADLRPLLQRKAVREVFNSDFDRGMFSSVIAGVQSLAPSVSACFLLPTDMPLVGELTIRLLALAFQRHAAPVHYPVYRSHRGHPPLIRRDVLEAAPASEPEGGLRDFLAVQHDVQDVAVEDEAVLLDMDTPADLQLLREHEASLTASVCPICLRRIEARRVTEGDDIYLVKSCVDHGTFRTILWRGLPSFHAWGGNRRDAATPPVCATTVDRGCPFDCGLCPDHRQQTCCVVLEVTRRCNLSCPFCFASAGGSGDDVPLEEITSRCEALRGCGGPFNIQLSGGEPTVREDLPQIVSRIRSAGFPFVQLNTNGLRLAADAAYASALKAAGLSCVFLQFDGLSEDVYLRIRGRNLMEAKLAAIRNCAASELGVVLVPTLVPGVNTAQIGDIIRFAISQMPAVRAVHFQPVSYFGRYPRQPDDSGRITIPEVLRAIEQQTAGAMRVPHFLPPSAENAWCSFQGKFVIGDNGVAAPVTAPPSCCGSSAGFVQLGAGGDAQRARKAVARQWAFPEISAPNLPAGISVGSLDAVLERGQRTLSISGMAFQDAWNLDLARLRDCFVHAAGKGRLVPLCAYNLTASDGRALYRGGEADD